MAKVNADRFRKRATEHKAQGGGGGGYIRLDPDLPFYKPKAGVNLIDIIPYEVSDKKHLDKAEVGELWPRRPIKTHFKIGVDEKSVLCPLTIGKPCPICAHRKTANLDEDGKKALLPKDREVMFVVPYDGDGAGKLHVWEISYHLFGKMLEEEVEADENVAGFYDPKEGLTLKVRFNEKQMGKQKFLEAKRIDFEERDAPISKKILEQVQNLDQCMVIMEYAALERQFLGVDDPVDEDDEPRAKKRAPVEDEDEAPRKKKPAPKEDDEEDDPKPKKKAKPEPEEDEEPPAKSKKKPAKDEDDEDAPPAKPKRGSKPADDEDEDPPAKKKGKAKDEDGDECPHGGTYGTDCNSLDECEKCNVWEECQEKKRELRKAAKAGK
jgi:hypothetical protein